MQRREVLECAWKGKEAGLAVIKMSDDAEPHGANHASQG